METAKIFMNGGSQAVRLPKDCRFEEEEVLVNRIGNVVMLIPKDDWWEAAVSGLEMFTEDFMTHGIEELPLKKRETIK